MAEKLLWTVGVQAVGGPQLAAASALDVDAYDKLAITVPANGTADVALGPAGVAVTCLVIVPPAGATGLSYEIDGNAITLDAPLVLLGGAVALTGGAETLTFTNADAADAAVGILVGRDAS
ncbi:MAG TPA: hypothetical protein VNH13_06420 [Candidatus Acidoferrales bacterium]|nr:hypothetical protein [Candidatus Acidoferrales bacterium]